MYQKIKKPPLPERPKSKEKKVTTEEPPLVRKPPIVRKPSTDPKARKILIVKERRLAERRRLAEERSAEAGRKRLEIKIAEDKRLAQKRRLAEAQNGNGSEYRISRQRSDANINQPPNRNTRQAPRRQAQSNQRSQGNQQSQGFWQALGSTLGKLFAKKNDSNTTIKPTTGTVIPSDAYSDLVAKPQCLSFTSDKLKIEAGEEIILQWAVTGEKSKGGIVITPKVTMRELTNNAGDKKWIAKANPESTVTYTLIATNDGGVEVRCKTKEIVVEEDEEEDVDAEDTNSDTDDPEAN